MNAIWRVVRAFFEALRLTITGQRAKPSPLVTLRAWAATSAELARKALEAGDASGFDGQARTALTLSVEGRRVSIETVLQTVRFHAEQEYTHILDLNNRDDLAAIYAANVNDRFLTSRAFDALEAGAFREAVGQLFSHLENIPALEAQDKSIENS